uniref:UDP-4-amino-4, 6-dideoxy-N-acetyl-beta-L-altrosamine transaminase n=1 Tax=Flavobacterium sp. TaxID=239 RepID=UPI00404A9C2F
MNNKIIPYGKQNITKDDIDAVVHALNGDYLTQGPTILEFEKKFSNYIGSKYSVAVSNGTAALHLCALALGVKNGDKVIITPITFAASANCIRYCEGDVVFSDIDPSTYLIDLVKVEELLVQNPTGTFKGIIPVNFAGRSVNIEKLRDLAKTHNLWILEDACHAPGAYFIDSKGVKQNSGNCTYSDLSIFSFHPVKHIATGEGGMITTSNEKLYNKLLSLRTHGITKESKNFTNNVDLANGIKGAETYPGWYMEMQNLGFNYRFTDFQAALGISQLSRAEAGLIRRKQIAEIYRDAFANKEFIINQSGLVEGHAYHLYVIEVKDRLGLYNYLKQNNIYCQIHYIPCHLMPYYKSLGWKENDMPYAEEYYKNCISIPMFPSLTDEEVEYVIEKINKYYE